MIEIFQNIKIKKNPVKNKWELQLFQTPFFQTLFQNFILLLVYFTVFMHFKNCNLPMLHTMNRFEMKYLISKY